MLKKVIVNGRWGIHAEVAARLCEISRRHKFCHIFIKHDRRMASLMNISQVLALGVKQGDEIVIIADGENEDEVIQEVISAIQYTQ